MISSSDFNVPLLGNWVLEHTQHTEEGRPGGGCHLATVSNEARLVAASARISCPLARSYLAVSVQDLMAADKWQAPSIRSGGLQGSDERSEVIVPGAGDIELNGVVYTKGKTVWMALVGCTVACYNSNAFTLGQVIGSVKVRALASMKLTSRA